MPALPLSEEVKLATIEAFKNAGGNKAQAARALGIPRTTLADRIEGIKMEGLLDDWCAPVDVPQGMSMGKTTVQYNARGEVIQEWRRLSPSQQALELFAKELAKDVAGGAKVKKRTPRKHDKDDILLEVCLCDAHIGMYAWRDETRGKSYDTDIASEVVINSTAELCDRAARLERPKAAMIVFNGDQFHSDNRSGKTEMSGNVLDVDGRYERNITHGYNTLTQAVNLAAAVAEKVYVLVVPGNHDWHTSVCFKTVLDAHYRNCDNVEVILDPAPRHAFQWGNNMLCHAHGDRVKPANWAQIIAAEFKKMWGDTTYCYLFLGHIHHSKAMAPIYVDEQAGLYVEYLKAICPSDAWHAEAGYIGTIRGADAFMFHKQHGQYARFTYNV